MKEKRSCPTPASRVGGQAVLEGIMMKGVEKTSLAIRKVDGSVYLETWENKGKKWGLNIFT